MRAIKRAVAVTGEYTDRDTGKPKKQYTRLGTLFKDDEKGYISLKLDSIPVGEGWNGWVSFFDLEGKKAQQDAGMSQQGTTPDNFEDQDIPFAPYMRDSIV